MKFVLIRSYGRTGETWFGPAPYGERWFLIGDDGQEADCGRSRGSMFSLAPGPRDRHIDAAFGRHQEERRGIIETVEIPEGSTGVFRDGYPKILSPHPTLPGIIQETGVYHPGKAKVEPLLWREGRLLVQDCGDRLIPLKDVTLEEFKELCQSLGRPDTSERWCFSSSSR